MWNQALTNEELGNKFKATLKEYIQNSDVNNVGEYLRELSCHHYLHEFVKRAIILAIETAKPESISQKPTLRVFAEQYRKELVSSILPFWVENSPDRVNGGFFTCLDRTGKVFDTDKFIWLQGREVWCFSFMYANLEARPEWLEMALLGADFLEKHGRDADGNWYFSLTADGKPLVQPYNIFSDCFATMAFAALYKIKPEERYKKIALDTFENILRR